MKINNFIFALLSILLFTACDNVLEQEVDLDVNVEAADYLQFNDTAVVAPVGSKITFNFSGEPDFISFSYERFLPTNATLKFATQAAWGTHVENTLNVFVSGDFPELALNDFAKDSTTIRNHTWTDISALCNLPAVANQKKNAEVAFNEYRGKKMVIAFRYKPTFAADFQPLWIISDLQINNTKITDGSNISTFLAASMGFTPFDILNRTIAYSSKDTAGVWNTNDKAAMKIRQTFTNKALNEDWLISKPIDVPRGLTEVYPEKGTKGLKNITQRLDSYTHTFDKVGEYVVSFKASNYNYQYQSSVIKTVKLIITD